MKKFLAVVALAAVAAWAQAEGLDEAVAETVQEEAVDGELAAAASAGVSANSFCVPASAICWQRLPA